VGANGPTQLATIVQTNPVYVNFTISEQEVLKIRAEMRRLGVSKQEVASIPIEVGLQNDTGYPYQGTLDYVSPSVDSATGTLAVRAIMQNQTDVLVPGYFVRVRAASDEQNSLLVPDAALGSDQGGRYVLVVNKDNVVEQRKVTIGPKVGDLRAIESGIESGDRVVVAGILRAIPGQKVDPQMQTIAAPPAPAAGAAK
jgi:RND family efflux transporter MFP subunit